MFPYIDMLLDCQARILSSAGFVRAPRMCRLFDFLVRHKLENPSSMLNEYAIGIEVFGRDAASYDTCGDPIVRVQIGRLRSKLRDYFDRASQHEPLRLSIPLGSYRLLVEPAAHTPVAGHLRFDLHCLCADADAHAFANGIRDEVYYLLHRDPVRVMAAGLHADASLRVDTVCVRVLLRLHDTVRAHASWMQQMDFPADLSIRAQQTIACEAHAWLKQTLERGG